MYQEKRIFQGHRVRQGERAEQSHQILVAPLYRNLRRWNRFLTTCYVFISHNLVVALDNRIVHERNRRFVTRMETSSAETGSLPPAGS